MQISIFSFLYCLELCEGKKLVCSKSDNAVTSVISHLFVAFIYVLCLCVYAKNMWGRLKCGT